MLNTFSICIPNFNYEKYIGITLNSVFSQSYQHYEVIVTDNASTDKSVDIITEFANKHTNLSYKVNRINVGFAGNLDESGRMAVNDYMIMLSSDDVINNDALSTYNTFINLINSSIKHRFAFCSTFEKIDAEGTFLNLIGPSSLLWRESDIADDLTNEMGCKIYKVASGEMLKRCISRFSTPFNFASACYMADTYKSVGGYGGGRSINPDKWFHWKVLADTDYVYFIDKPLFQYRWHNNNQGAQQTRDQLLKFWVDDYKTSFESTAAMLTKAAVNQYFVNQSFIDRSIMPYVLQHLLRNDFDMARRIFYFGLSCYPKLMRRNKYYLISKIILISSWTGNPILALIKLLKRNEI